MRVLLLVFAILFFAGGVFAVVSVRSDIQLILAAVLFGFAITFFALAWVLREVLGVEDTVLGGKRARVER